MNTYWIKLRVFSIKGKWIDDKFQNLVEKIIKNVEEEERERPITIVIDFDVYVKSVVQIKSLIEMGGSNLSKKVQVIFNKIHDYNFEEAVPLI